MYLIIFQTQIAHSVGCAFIVFRINYPDSLLSSDSSSWVVLVYTAIFGASMALFASHFIYRYGSIDINFGDKFTSGWKFGILFFIPIVTGIWWSTVVRVWFWPNTDMNEYTRDMIMEHVGVDIENISYIGAKFYNEVEGNLTKFLNAPAWIGVSQMWFMVISSMVCVFGFGAGCYLRLSNQLSMASSAANNLQIQLFYALVLQTAIPLILMHIPITIYFLCPMLDLDFDFASSFVASTITLYPAVDPLPSILIIKNYRKATFGE
uniref:Seven TM Receptor n=1 Tax=Caenorhabditis tropicalis TaxID=1561998 RepID=A0A1I7T0A2_9PELO